MAKGKYENWITEDGLVLIGGWARDGLTEEQIAKNAGVSYSTFRTWKDKYPALSAALKKTKEAADIDVENALFKRATGYEYEEVTKELRFNRKTGTQELVETKRITKRMPPDVTAQIFWLKNRRPDRWRDKRPERQEEGNETGITIINDAPGADI